MLSQSDIILGKQLTAQRMKRGRDKMRLTKTRPQLLTHPGTEQDGLRG
jgi:hypothetical protein